jgi:hypothetical protein
MDDKTEKARQDYGSALKILHRAVLGGVFAAATLAMVPNPANGQLLPNKEMIRDSSSKDKEIVPAPILISPSGLPYLRQFLKLPFQALDSVPKSNPNNPNATIWVQDRECWIVGKFLNCYREVVLMAIPKGVSEIASDVLIARYVLIDPDIHWGGRWARGDEIKSYLNHHNNGDFQRPGFTIQHESMVGHQRGLPQALRQPGFLKPELRG